jgi:hypothetical protein
MPQSETFAQAEVRLRAERVAKDQEARKKHWADLLKELRAANPSQTITYDGKDNQWRSLVVDGTEFRVELGEKRSGRAGDYHRVGRGVYYFVIGDWRRGGNRPRANQTKTGFDWARIAQLVEDERKYIAAKGESEKNAALVLARANAELDALFKRRPDLEDQRYTLDISSRTGRFTYTARDLDIDKLERVMDLARHDDGDG